MSRPTTEGVIAVICHRHRYLLIRRSHDVPVPGAWCFPGGAVKPGETQEQAIAREVFEEVHLHVEAGEKVWEWTRPDGGLRLHFWSARLLDGHAQPTPAVKVNTAEVIEARWMTSDEIRRLDGTIPNLLEFLDHWEQPAR